MYEDIETMSSSPSQGHSEIGSPTPSEEAQPLCKPITGAEYLAQPGSTHPLTKIKLAAALSSRLTIQEEHAQPYAPPKPIPLPYIADDEPTSQENTPIHYTKRYEFEETYAPSEYLGSPSDSPPPPTPPLSPNTRRPRSPSPFPHSLTQKPVPRGASDAGRRVLLTEDGQMRILAGERGSVPTDPATQHTSSTAPTKHHTVSTGE